MTPPPPKEANLQTHYEELLRVIAEVGKDIKPAYTNNKVSADRLKRSKRACIYPVRPHDPHFHLLTDIAVARGVLRDCLNDIEKLHQLHAEK